LTEITTGVSVKNMKLLYKATPHGFATSAFHSRCDNKQPTLVLIKNDQNQLFGGFTKQTWNDTADWKKDPDAFLFSVNKKKKYPIKNPQKAIYCNSSYGPTFGCNIYRNGHAIYIHDNSNTSNSNY